jgi:N-hydroxyarylamine O-acetyltransferase
MKTPLTDYKIDLNAYFAKLGYAGSQDPTLETLAALQLLHQKTISFENLDPFLNRPVLIDLPSLELKLVFSERGGYCYEQNLLFAHVLHRLGFTVSNLLARVLWGADEHAITARSHMLLHVRLDHRPYIVDVGFGGNSIPAPMVMNRENVQQTSHGAYRCLLIDGDYWLQVHTNTGWRNMYRFDLTRQHPVDYIAPNYYTSTHEDSHFRHSVVAARIFQNGRYTLRNNLLTTRYEDGQTEQTVLESAQAAQAALHDVFGICVPDMTAFAKKWQLLARGWEMGARPLVREPVQVVAQGA